MRIRWGRVTMALGSLAVGVPALLLGGFWLTMPEPGEAVRQDPGALPCVTSEVLTGALPMHPKHDPEPARDERDEGAAAALIAATRCEQVSAIPHPQLFGVFSLASHGLAWIEANEAPDEALAQTVEIWQLARDQQQAGSYMEVAVWQGIALLSAETAERLLSRDPLLHAPVRARLRHQLRPALQHLAGTWLEWDSIGAREEQALWDLATLSLTDGRWLLEMASYMPVALTQARFGTGAFFEDRVKDHEKERTLASALARSI